MDYHSQEDHFPFMKKERSFRASKKNGLRKKSRKRMLIVEIVVLIVFTILLLHVIRRYNYEPAIKAAALDVQKKVIHFVNNMTGTSQQQKEDKPDTANVTQGRIKIIDDSEDGGQLSVEKEDRIVDSKEAQ